MVHINPRRSHNIMWFWLDRFTTIGFWLRQWYLRPYHTLSPSHINKSRLQLREAFQRWMCLKRAGLLAGRAEPPSNLTPSSLALPPAASPLTPSFYLVQSLFRTPPSSTHVLPLPRNIGVAVCLWKKVAWKDQKEKRDAISVLNQHGSCFIIHVELWALLRTLTSSLINSSVNRKLIENSSDVWLCLLTEI